MSNASIDTGGLPLASFDLVDEFCVSVESGAVATADRRIHGDHPLVSLVEGALESWSQRNVGALIVGLTKRSTRLLDEARLSLEEKDREAETQKLLYAFTQVIDLFRSASYSQASAEESNEFFEEAFPVWLDCAGLWAQAMGLGPLSVRINTSLRLYRSIEEKIMAPTARPFTTNSPPSRR